MSQKTIGEVDWENGDVPGDRPKEDRPSDFMVLAQGDNKGRVLSNPQQFYVHWLNDETGQKRKVGCAVESCPVCKRGQDTDKAQTRWLIKFLDRTDSRIKLLEISSQIFKGIKTLVGDPDWGPVTDYDINVKRGPKGAQPLYTVVPSKRIPLTTEEKQALAVFNERVDVTRFTKSPTPAEVAEKLGWAPAADSKTVNNSFASGKGNGASTGKPVSKVPTDFDFDSQ